ncbi:expressed protein [Echinococcus multilocularis]|uniref:Expressed protein n=1 Tax=Echinococcus multilocularis TaxID=6211 RepID=A0A087VWB7_ECHMU|nr:expressed protein [Echinococcus multilocularis]
MPPSPTILTLINVAIRWLDSSSMEKSKPLLETSSSVFKKLTRTTKSTLRTFNTWQNVLNKVANRITVQFRHGVRTPALVEKLGDATTNSLSGLKDVDCHNV